jgi:large subunit ribosomal protein L12
MEYVYAALLLHSAGKDVNEEGIKKVVEAAGVAADDVRIKALVAALEGVDITKVLSQATAMPVAAAAAAPAAAAAAPAAAKAEEKEESKQEAEESGVEGLGALFG